MISSGSWTKSFPKRGAPSNDALADLAASDGRGDQFGKQRFFRLRAFSLAQESDRSSSEDEGGRQHASILSSDLSLGDLRRLHDGRHALDGSQDRFRSILLFRPGPCLDVEV